MKTVVGLSQFFKQNEPKVAALLGNIALILAFIAGTIMSMPALLLEVNIVFVLPPMLLLVVKYCTVGGVVIKMITKLWGTIDSLGQSVSTTLPSTVGMADTIVTPKN